MINSFLDSYCDYFNRYSNGKEQAYTAEAKIIADVLTKNHDLERMSQEISKILEPLSLPSEYSLIEKPSSFLKITNELNTDILIRKNLKLDEFITHIQAISTINNSIKHLLSFLTETLRHPNFLLHSRTRALTSTFIHLDNIIDHLKTLAPVERPLTPPRPGSFDAEIIRNEAHSGCIDLIRANSAVYNENNTTWTVTNGLLQELLIINRELTTIEPPPKPSRCLIQ